jgi:cell division initiation protein
MFNSEDSTPTVETRRLPSPNRHSAVTPLDVRQARFSSAMRGYARSEVNTFLLEAADGYEQATRDNERLRQELLRLETALSQYRELEGTLKGALLSAQKVADDMKETAALEAARIVREAEGRAQIIAQQAEAQLDDTRRGIDGLRLKRRESEMALESMIAALHSTLEFVREKDQRETRVIPRRPLLAVAQSA